MSRGHRPRTENGRTNLESENTVSHRLAWGKTYLTRPPACPGWASHHRDDQDGLWREPDRKTKSPGPLRRRLRSELHISRRLSSSEPSWQLRTSWSPAMNVCRKEKISAPSPLHFEMPKPRRRGGGCSASVAGRTRQPGPKRMAILRHERAWLPIPSSHVVLSVNTASVSGEKDGWVKLPQDMFNNDEATRCNVQPAVTGRRRGAGRGAGARATRGPRGRGAARGTGRGDRRGSG